MPSYMISEDTGFEIKFGSGGDLLILASGEKIRTGTFLYGSGKAGHGDISTSLQDRLMYLFAPLARGEVLLNSNHVLARDAIVTLDCPRAGDRIKIAADDKGNIAFHLKGQDMGFPEAVCLSLPYALARDNGAYPVQQALHRLLHQL